MVTVDDTDFESVRVTTDQYDVIEDIFGKLNHWAYCKEVGTETGKPHVHVVFKMFSGYKQNTLRKKLIEMFGSGNGTYSFKKEGKNTLGRAMAYVMKDGNYSAYGDIKTLAESGDVPKWVDPETLKKRKREENDDDYSKPGKQKHYLLGYSNLVKQSLRYRARFLAKDSRSKDLSFVLAHMYVHSDWRLATTVLKQGIPRTLYTEFEASVNHTMVEKFAPGYFNLMIRDDAHDNRDRW